MEITRISIKDIIDSFEITKNKAEFVNDLNLFFNIIAFDNSDEEYYSIIKNKFDDYMKEWNISLDKKFTIISKYIKSNKLPYKIAKDEGFENIKSDKFIVSILVELYAIKIIINSKNTLRKNDIINFIYRELTNNVIQVKKSDIVLRDLDYIFKDDNVFNICKGRLLSKQAEIEEAFSRTVKVLEKRKNVNITLSYIINDRNFTKIDNTTNLKTEIEYLKNQIKLREKIIDGYIEKEKEFNIEIEKLKNQNVQLLSIENEQYTKAIIDLVKNLNDPTNGNLLDRLYCYLKDENEKNMPFIISNLLNVLRQMGIYPRETIKLGEVVSIEEYSFYNYRLNKDISDIKLCEGQVMYPAWFYNEREILKPYVNIKGE